MILDSVKKNMKKRFFPGWQKIWDSWLMLFVFRSVDFALSYPVGRYHMGRTATFLLWIKQQAILVVQTYYKNWQHWKISQDLVRLCGIIKAPTFFTFWWVGDVARFNLRNTRRKKQSEKRAAFFHSECMLLLAFVFNYLILFWILGTYVRLLLKSVRRSIAQ